MYNENTIGNSLSLLWLHVDMIVKADFSPPYLNEIGYNTNIFFSKNGVDTLEVL